ncbi:MAG: hypothetical protein JSR58_00235 [Verrucomicrobia bacterium]|nr:hypothetical protein [Verrucomicrobiota bacterium]
MILISAILAAAPVMDSGTVSSSSANYDGNALLLKGEVMLDHGLGKMRAEEAKLQRQEVGKDFPFSMIHLQKKVALLFKDGAEVSCDTADLDFSALQGALTSSEKVVYTDTWKKKKAAAIAFRLLSPQIDLTLSKQDKEGKASYDIDQAIAKNSVLVDYGTDFHLAAESATYNKAKGQITALPADKEHPCQLTHKDDVVFGVRAFFDLGASRVDLDAPVGTLRLPEQEQIDFSANALSWDMGKNVLVLRGKAHITQAPMGTIDSEDIIQLHPQLVKTQGKTVIVYQNHHKLTSYGPLVLDRTKLRATADTPKGGQQIVYEEGQLTAYADQAVVEYSESWEPVSVALKGSVKVFSTDPKAPKRVGISDRITYLPPNRTFILAANPGKKVLFLNEEQNLRISATEVHITEDATTHEQAVKGIGSVQLTFSPEEQAALEKLTQLMEKLP